MEKKPLATELKGERITLKIHPITFKHAEEIYKLVDKNREHLAILEFPEFTNSVEDVFTGFLLDEVKKGVKTCSNYEYMILKNGEYIGNISVFNVRYKHERAELAYWIDSAYSGYGYVTEAVQLLENYLFELGFNKIEIKTGDINIPSMNIAKKCGYQKDGIIRDYKILDEKFYNQIIFSKLKGDLK